MIRIVRPSEVPKKVFDPFIRRHLDKLARRLFDALRESFPEDVLVATNASRPVAVGTIVRVAPGCSAIANFRVGKSADDASSKLLSVLLQRASGIGNDFVSCIPGRDRQPSDGELQKLGFTKQGVRSIFVGPTRMDSEAKAETLTDTSAVSSMLEELPTKFPLAIHFRPVNGSLSTIPYLLSHGPLLTIDHRYAAFVTISQAITDETRIVFAPDYAAKRIPNNQMVRVGEISLVKPDAQALIVNAALRWLASQGVGVATVYSPDQTSLGTKIHNLGLDPLPSQVVWKQELKGPLDTFALQA